MSQRNSNGKGIDRRGFLGAAAHGGAALGDGKVAIPAAPVLGFEPDRDAVRDITVEA